MSYFLLGAFVLALAIWWWITPKTAEDELVRLDADFQRQYGHLSLEDRIALKRNLLSFARVRRIASAAAATAPQDAMLAIEEAAEAEAATLPRTQRRLFLSVVRDSRPSDVLYGDAHERAFRAAMARAQRQKKQIISEDEIASMRVL